MVAVLVVVMRALGLVLLAQTKTPRSKMSARVPATKVSVPAPAPSLSGATLPGCNARTAAPATFFCNYLLFFMRLISDKKKQPGMASAGQANTPASRHGGSGAAGGGEWVGWVGR